MRSLIENLFATAAVVGTEAWFLKGYFAGQPDFEPAIALIAAIGVLLAKDPIRTRLSAPDASKTHDQALFGEFLQILPFDPSIRFLRDQDFADSIHRASLQPLFDFAFTWQNVEKEFLDKELERERKALVDASQQFKQEIAGRTIPIRMEGFISAYSDQQRAGGHGRPPEVIEDGRVLNALATAFVPKYESFLRLCKAKLAK